METSYAQHPMPQLCDLLPNTHAPWQVSPNTFQKVQQADSNEGYRKSEITSNDPEWAFVLRYFEWQKPTNRCIKKVYCIHSPERTQQFQLTIADIEKEVKNLAFTPKWRQEENAFLRQKVHQRWKAMTDPYSPVIIETSGRQECFTNTKILPLWHGTKKNICHSICQSGFTFFGKQDILQGKKDQNTDTGYFGSGIYFTNSARYATEIYSDGNLLLAWVCMREPYPVVAHAPNLYPNKPKDMVNLEGRGAYQNYNAHHIPIISVEPSNSNCSICYPCSDYEEPQCDEIVVFQKSQTLTRFWIETEIEIAKSPEAKLTIGTFFQNILDLLEIETVKQNSNLSRTLEEKADFLINLDFNQTMPEKEAEFCRWTMQLLDQNGKVRDFVSKKLLTLQTLPSKNNDFAFKLAANNRSQLHTADSSYVSQFSFQDQFSNFNHSMPQRLPYNNNLASTNSFSNNSLQQQVTTNNPFYPSPRQQMPVFENVQQRQAKNVSVSPTYMTCKGALEGHTDIVKLVKQLHGGILASGSADTTIRIWNPATKECLLSLHSHTKGIQKLKQLSEKTLASGSDDGTVKIWDLETGHCQHTFEVDKFGVRFLKMLPNGDLLAGGTFGLKILNLKTGQYRHTLSEDKHFIDDIKILSLDTLASFAGNGENAKIKIWNFKTGKCLRTLDSQRNYNSGCYVRKLSLHKNGMLISPCQGSSLEIWDTQSWQLLHTLPKNSWEGRNLALLSDGTCASGAYSVINVWDPKKGICLYTLRDDDMETVEMLTPVSENILASGSREGRINIWDLKARKCLHSLYGHSKSISYLKMLPNGILVSGSHEPDIKLWDVKTGDCLQTIQMENKDCSGLWKFPLKVLSNGTLAHASQNKIVLWEK